MRATAARADEVCAAVNSCGFLPEKTVDGSFETKSGHARGRAAQAAARPAATARRTRTTSRNGECGGTRLRRGVARTGGLNS
ncbi:MAG: hypothetical protein ACLR4Z_03140 [Butyricicoccaceae bacterium]